MKKPKLTYYDLDKHVVAFSTTRNGGYSTGNYAEFNITHYCGDNPEAVRQNRKVLCQLLDIEHDSHLILPRQTHGTEIRQVDKAFLKLSEEKQREALEGIDAIMTSILKVCIGVSTADCIPILIYDRFQRVICAIHAGWRGTVARIVEKAVAAMTETYNSHPCHMVAQIGPGIGLDSFEVGDEVYKAFYDAGFDMTLISKKYAKWHIDLPECNRLQLLACGIPTEHISVSLICTVKNSDTFFSARRLGINSGRIFTGIMLNPIADSTGHNS